MTKQNSSSQQFGGPWTEEKLRRFRDYLTAYNTALKEQPFKRLYVDAFAGTGYRELEQKGFSPDFFEEELTEEATQAFLDGSARIALQVEPGFHRYIFIEKNKKHCDDLAKLKLEFLQKHIQIEQGEANAKIQALCRNQDWKRWRAVLFLDPFGMEVHWKTIETIAATKAIDMWLLVPIGAMLRLLKRDGQQIPEEWRRRLDLAFGNSEWFDTFYRQKQTPTLFGDGDVQLHREANVKAVVTYFNERLKSVFAGVAPNPLLLRNSKDAPLFLLCFAAANEKGAPIAVRIAQHILGSPDGQSLRH